tara:strand:- start:42007 stop:42474 length:468 start_codon:yes stop_codon:yes gene_type:complete
MTYNGKPFKEFNETFIGLKSTDETVMAGKFYSDYSEYLVNNEGTMGTAIIIEHKHLLAAGESENCILTFYFKNEEDAKAQEKVMEENNIDYQEGINSKKNDALFLTVTFSKENMGPLLTSLTNTAMGGETLSNTVDSLVTDANHNKSSNKNNMKK